MEAIREFLETSTIHGLSYISTAPSKATKILWVSIVITGFFTAGYLINNSYSEWQASPVSTSILTLPISDLDFPTVTVCPPEGSNTVLNYDLMKAENHSFTIKDRDALKQSVYDAIIEPSHREHMRLMQATVNPDNIRKTYEGIQMFPTPNKKGIIEISMSSNQGEIQTPWFRGNYEGNYYKEDRHQQFEIQISENLKKSVENGSLVIRLEFDTRDEEGWQEVVTYSFRDYITYRKDNIFELKFHKREKVWAEAEAKCQREGGHLASIVTKYEQLLTSDASEGKSVWIGGTDQDQEGVWQWTDGSPWNETFWRDKYGGRRGPTRKCAALYYGNKLSDWSCTGRRNPYICQSAAKPMKNKTSITFNYTKDELCF